MKIVKSIDKGKCEWCGKDKPLVVVELATGNERAFCWTDLKRYMNIHLPTEQTKKA